MCVHAGGVGAGSMRLSLSIDIAVSASSRIATNKADKVATYFDYADCGCLCFQDGLGKSLPKISF